MPGVADVSNFGGLTTQYELELDPQQLMRFNISLSNITDAISANNANAGGSVLNRGELGYVIRGIGLVQTLDDLGNIVVTQHNGTPILVRDLGKLKLSNQERHGIVGKDDKNDVVEGTVLLLRHENPSRVLAGVHAKIDELNDRLKAENVQIVPYLDRTNLVDATIDKVGHTVFAGIGLVLIVLILFLGSPRSALIVGITVPFAMVVAFILMYHTGISANLLSLGAIDFGIIVDGAIVMTEAILRRREAKPNEPLTETDVARGGSPGGAADLLRHRDHHHDLSAAVCLPAHRGEAVLSDGLCGRLRAVRRAGVRVAGGPGLGLRGLSQAAPRLSQSGAGLARGGLSANALRVRCAARASPTLLSVAAAIAVVVLGATVWREFLPDLDEGSIWLHAEMPPGISLQKATDMVAELRRALNEFPEVSSVVSHIGRNDDGTDPWTPSHMEAAVRLTPVQHLAGRRDQAGSGSSACRRGSTNCRASRSRSASRSWTACSTTCSIRTARSPSRSSATTSTSCGASAMPSSAS